VVSKSELDLPSDKNFIVQEIVANVYL